ALVPPRLWCGECRPATSHTRAARRRAEVVPLTTVAATLDSLVERIRGAGAAAAPDLAQRVARHAAALCAHVWMEALPQDGDVARGRSRVRQRHLDQEAHEALLASRRLQPPRRQPCRLGKDASIRPPRRL